MADQLGQQWRDARAGRPVSLLDAEASALWQRLVEFPAEVPPSDGSSWLMVSVAVSPGATVQVVDKLRRLDPRGSVQAHAGNGLILARLPLVSPGRARDLLEARIRPDIDAAGGNAVVLASPAEAALARCEIWGPPAPDHALLRSIKRQFDPKGILNAGRFIFDDDGNEKPQMDTDGHR